MAEHINQETKILMQRFIKLVKDEGGEVERLAAKRKLNVSIFKMSDMLTTLTFIAGVYEYQKGKKTYYGISFIPDNLFIQPS
jgi:hypothetical protein